MMTVRQIERLWNARQYGRLFREMMAGRPEASLRLEGEIARSATAAAVAIIRLDELSQPHVPLFGTLVRAILASQERDGGWGEPMATSLCLRALLCGNGHGEAVERGMRYLADLQKDEGIWPAVPLRRMPADPYVSAFVLFQLGSDASFRTAVRFDRALRWYAESESGLDGESRRLWDRAGLRCGVRTARTPPAAEAYQF